MAERVFGMKTLRTLEGEHETLDLACAALQGLDRATSIMEAALFEAHRLGIGYSVWEPPPFKGPWRYLLERGEEVTCSRLTITLNLTTLGFRWPGGEVSGCQRARVPRRLRAGVTSAGCRRSSREPTLTRPS